MILGISGLAGSGKDTVADILVRDYRFAKVAFADPLKRIVRDVYDFTDDQLWGPSEARNGIDTRYPREHTWVIQADGILSCICCSARKRTGIEFKGGSCYLTPRHALQQLGTEWGRGCYPDTWVDLAMRTAHQLSEEGGYTYTRYGGLRHDWRPGELNWKTSVAISDVRFKNEVEGLYRHKAKVIRVVRPGSGLLSSHQSETEQMQIPDYAFDLVIQNSGSLEQLRDQVHQMMKGFQP